ncbi:MAG: N-formylglutamate amidohydrolase [Alphaproteobacteria bacterium]|nr:N-formylglutamate amidohydrolase [Alphaproteobacteria bacterium]
MSSQPDRDDRLCDSSLDDLYATPFTISRPSRQLVPFVFASPHSGSCYPRSFSASSRLSSIALRRSEDAFVDELFAGVVSLGAPLIAARFPRAFLDVNRAPGEIDPSMFEGRLSLPVEIPSSRVAAGLGVIPRIVRDGAEIYRARLPASAASDRLRLLYEPYHRALAGLVAETLDQFGVAVLIDCHSMPSAAAIPDIVLGDRYGASAVPSLTRHAETSFQFRGFRVARNMPYAGGYTTLLHGRRDSGVHALQIEVNRMIYLDEENIVRAPQFASAQACLQSALQDLVAIAPSQLGRPQQSLRYAAE